MGYWEPVSSEFVARNMQKDANIATRIAEFQVDVILSYLCGAPIGVQYGASGDGRDAARTRAHQR